MKVSELRYCNQDLSGRPKRVVPVLATSAHCVARARPHYQYGAFFRRFGGERKERLLGRVALCSFLPGCGRLSNGQDQFQREEGRKGDHSSDYLPARAIFFPCGKFHIRQLRESLLPKWGQSGFASGSLLARQLGFRMM